MLGEIWTYAEFARAAVRSAEVEAFDYGNGVWFPYSHDFAPPHANNGEIAL